MKLRPTISAAPDVPVMVESEVAYYLRQELGPVVVWPFFLSGLRRIGSDDSGLPYLFKAARRYYYAEADVDQFIEAFRAESPDSEAGIPPNVIRAADVAQTSLKRQIRYRNDDLITIRPKAGASTTLH